MQKAGKTDIELKAMFSELEPIAIPPGTEYLFSTFENLSSSRTYGFSGANPISYLEIKSYCDLMNETLSPWEIDTIRLMDTAFLDESQQILQQQKDGK